MTISDQLIPLTEQMIDRLKQCGEVQSFSRDVPLFYEGQVPVVSYVLLEGRMDFTLRGQPVEQIPTGNLMGLHNLIHHDQINYGAMAHQGTKVLTLSKSCIKEIMERKVSELNEIITKVINS